MTDVQTDEIMPYVAVGPSEDLSFTIHKDTFDSGFIAFTIFGGIIILIVVGVVIFFAYQQIALPPPPPPLKSNDNDPTLQLNIGGTVSATAPLNRKSSVTSDGSSLITEAACNSVSHTVWTGDHCECQAPFFGPICSQEKHDLKYFAVGTPLNNSINIDVLQRSQVNGKSFSNSRSTETCSDQCNQNSECIGFLYHGGNQEEGICTLLKGNVIVPSERSIPYSYDQEATLYLRSSSNLHFEDRIFLGGFTGSIPPRFWLTKEQPLYLQLTPYEISRLTFAPTFTKMYGSYTGIYCRHVFTQDDIDWLLERGDTSECYIHHPGTNINLPIDWKNQVNNRTGQRVQLYVVYV